MSERGRRLELCKEWGEGTDGSDFDSWLMDKVIEGEERFQMHTEAVAKFLDEIYSIMVDPLEDGVRPVVVTMERIRQAALESREAGNK